MELMTNEVLRLVPEPGVKDDLDGLYRVVLDEPAHKLTVLVHIDGPIRKPSSRGGRPRQEKTRRKRRASRPPMRGKLLWLDRADLERREQHCWLSHVTVSREAIYGELAQHGGSTAADALWERRRAAMAGFLDIAHFHDSLIVHHGMGGLVREATKTGLLTRSAVYVQWSTLCRLGFEDVSLHPRLDRCGAPGVRRPSNPGKRKKAGRKTVKQRVEEAYTGKPALPEQPGMSTEWFALVLSGDAAIAAPKPRMRVRYDRIVETRFVSDWVQKGPVLKPVMPKQGHYPNYRQVQWALTTEYTRLQRLRQSTTPGHFARSLRGLRGTMREGSAGPGHMWAIDSTIGDIFLRSSLNRAWIVGRPIVYIIVDVWSTAVVGFHVCLAGPSWATAKLALFNACADPLLLGELGGYDPILSLDPSPTRPYSLMCDRGEYLSNAASATFIRLIDCASYAPPYRPDLKGLVEVLHRIAKDAAYHEFVPGAIDARRKEFELRQSDPMRSALTVREFVHYLHITFAIYNLTADRSHLVDAQMRAIGVVATPAGLWAFGHAAGIAFRRHTSPDDLVATLLATAEARIVSGGVEFDRARYEIDHQGMADWSGEARNFGRTSLPIYHYPGSTSRIWTPRGTATGLAVLPLSDQSQPSGVTREEYEDAFAYSNLANAQNEHRKTEQRLQGRAAKKAVIDTAVAATADAEALALGEQPSLSEARALERATVDRATV
jgi:putative transposase